MINPEGFLGPMRRIGPLVSKPRLTHRDVCLPDDDDGPRPDCVVSRSPRARNHRDASYFHDIGGPVPASPGPARDRPDCYSSTGAGVWAPSLLSTSVSGDTRRRCQNPSADSSSIRPAPMKDTMPVMSAI